MREFEGNAVLSRMLIRMQLSSPVSLGSQAVFRMPASCTDLRRNREGGARTHRRPTVAAASGGGPVVLRDGGEPMRYSEVVGDSSEAAATAQSVGCLLEGSQCATLKWQPLMEEGQLNYSRRSVCIGARMRGRLFKGSCVPVGREHHHARAHLLLKTIRAADACCLLRVFLLRLTPARSRRRACTAPASPAVQK